MSTLSSRKIGVILMTYGSATMADQVTPYLQRIYKGRASMALITDFENRYRAVGGSPLIEITKKQAALLEKKLGSRYVVRAGMRHSPPFIGDAVLECERAGVEMLLGIVLSPQHASFVLEGYTTDFVEAVQKSGIKNLALAPPWPREPHFIELLAKRIKKKLTELGTKTLVVFTTHSLPRRVVATDLSYLEQLRHTIEAVRKKLGFTIDWYQAFQSAGHTPEAWLTPDLTDIFAGLRTKRQRKVLIVPIQFVADHLEILYDLDIAARTQCEAFGLAYNRIELPNTDPLFISALANITKMTSRPYLQVSRAR